ERFQFPGALQIPRSMGNIVFSWVYFVLFVSLEFILGEAAKRFVARLRPLFCVLLPRLRVYSSVRLSTESRLESSKHPRIHRERNGSKGTGSRNRWKSA